MGATLGRIAAQLAGPNTDGELIARFVQLRDEAAFSALVHRHGPMVNGVCRRMLRQAPDADDAFQAVFLVLVQRAETLVSRRTLGDWLYGVAVRVGLKARTKFARLRKHEQKAAGNRSEPVVDPEPIEKSPWLDRELAALPDHLREPVVLCLIQERSRGEVAAELGIPEGTLASRLDTARKRLADRLARHRLPLVLAGLTAPVTAALADTTARRATDGATAAIHQLAHEVSKSMIANLKWPALVAAGVVTLAVTGLLLAGPLTADARNAKRNAPVPATPAPLEPAWMANFRKAYELKPDEYVKRVGPPYIDERVDFMLGTPTGTEVDAVNRRQYVENGSFYTCFVEQDGKAILIRYVLSSVGLKDAPLRQGNNLLSTMNAIRSVTQREEPEVVLDPKVKGDVLFSDTNRTVVGDFVIRKDAPLDKLVPQLEKILRDECNLEVRLKLTEEEQDVFVVGGEFKPNPPEWRPRKQLDFYATEEGLHKGYDPFNSRTWTKAEVASALYSGSPHDLIKFVGWRLNARMVWDKPATTPAKLDWHNHTIKKPTPEQEADDRDPDKVLKVVSEQTGLTFTKKKMKVPVLVVSKDEKAK